MSIPFSKYEMESNFDSVCVSSTIEIEFKKLVLNEFSNTIHNINVWA